MTGRHSTKLESSNGNGGKAYESQKPQTTNQSRTKRKAAVNPIMAESKAEDDDDEGFGDFTFASFPNHPIQINGASRNGPFAISTADDDDDDEWGDFVEFPPPSQPKLNSKTVDLFGFFPDQSAQSGSNGVELGKKEKSSQWEKPRGALPLSLFGDEGEAESSAADPSVVEASAVNFADNVRNETNSSLGVGINDIVANLYSQKPQIKADNGFGSGLNGFHLNQSNLNLKSDSNVRTENGFANSSQLFSVSSSNFGGEDLAFSELNSSINKVSGDEDFVGEDEGWEFKDAFTESKVGNGKDHVVSEIPEVEMQSLFKMRREMQVLPEMAIPSVLSIGRSVDLFAVTNGFPHESHKMEVLFDFKPSTMEQNGLAPNLYSKSDRKDGDNLLKSDPLATSAYPEENFGEFETAFPGPDSNKKVQEYPEAAMFSTGLQNGSNGPIDLFSSLNDFSSKSYKVDVGVDLKPSTIDKNGSFSYSYNETDRENGESGLSLDPVGVSVDSDENFGEFETAFPVAGSNRKEFPETATFSTDLQKGSSGPIDLFSALDNFSSKSYKVGVGVDFKPSTVDKNESFSYSYSENDWENGENRLNLDPVRGSADSDETFGEFEAAFQEAGSNQKGNEIRSENYKGAVPLSIFGIEESEADESLDIYEPPTTFPSSVQKHKKTLSINDILSDLYSQVDSVPSLDSKEKTTETGLESTDSILNSNLLDDDDNFDDGSWEFKDAVPQLSAEAQNPHSYHDDSNQNNSAYTEKNDYVDFYRNLKDDLCFVARYHLDNLKKAQSIATNSGEDAKVTAISKEIQEACDELHEENMISKEAHSYDEPPREISLTKYLEVLHELKFQAFESEYDLSRRLSLAESDLRSAVELIKHIKTMLKVFTLFPVKEQSDYVNSWSKMIYVCAQELKHGASIWGQAAKKNIQTRILSEPHGRQYILSLGEIYRVVVILGASVKFYKPWVFSTSVDSTSLYDRLEECHTLWSTLGLEETLEHISDSEPEYKDNIKSLLESINHIRNLDVDGMANFLSIKQEDSCRLSALTPAVVPGLKLVNWNGKNYFVTLANLWANLISSDPPTLPCIQVG